MNPDNIGSDMLEENLESADMYESFNQMGYVMPQEFDFDNFDGCNVANHQTFNCGRDQQVIRHQHVVKYQHDVVNEYDVVHEHDINHYDVVRHRDVVRHNDCRTHQPNYCNNPHMCGDGHHDHGAMGRHHHGRHNGRNGCCRRRFW